MELPPPPPKPPIVAEAERLNRDHVLKYMLPFLLWCGLGGVVLVPAGIHLATDLVANQLASQLTIVGVVIAFLLSVAAAAVPLFKNGKDVGWTVQVIQQWRMQQAMRPLPQVPQDGDDPVLLSARTMAGRIQSLLATDHQAESAANTAVERASALIAERDALETSLAGLAPGGEGAGALGEAIAAIDAELQRTLDELASLYAALAAERAGAPPAAEAALTDAIDRVQARAEVAAAMLQKQR